jgi:hypothetical protein
MLQFLHYDVSTNFPIYDMAYRLCLLSSFVPPPGEWKGKFEKGEEPIYFHC